jgi:hypothetical protein
MCKRLEVLCSSSMYEEKSKVGGNDLLDGMTSNDTTKLSLGSKTRMNLRSQVLKY